jgi:hypothetical protein
MAKIRLLHLRKSNGYTEPALDEGIRGHHPEDVLLEKQNMFFTYLYDISLFKITFLIHT